MEEILDTIICFRNLLTFSTSKKNNLDPKKSKFHAWVKKCHFGTFTRNRLDWPCPVSAALQNRPQDFFFLFCTILIFIYFFKYETIVRSTAWSFGHSDPDPSSVLEHMAFLEKKIDLSLPYDDKSSEPICFPLWDMAWLWGSLEKKAFFRRISIYLTIYRFRSMKRAQNVYEVSRSFFCPCVFIWHFLLKLNFCS